MKTTTRWATAILFLLGLSAINCASSGGQLPPIDWSKIPVPPIVIVDVPKEDPKEPPKPEEIATLAIHVRGNVPDVLVEILGTEKFGKTNEEGYVAFVLPRKNYHAVLTKEGYVRVDQAVDNEQGNKQHEVELTKIPHEEPVKLENLNITVVDENKVGISPSSCVVKGERRTSDGAGFINFAVDGPVIVTCSASGYLTSQADVAPGNVPMMLKREKVELPTPPTTPTSPPPSSSLEADRVACKDMTGIDCVRKIEVLYRSLLNTNTYASTVEFTQHVLQGLGEPWGHVGKTAGEGQAVPRGFATFMATKTEFPPAGFKGADGNVYQMTGVSHDAIKNRVTGQVVDILGNATANEPCKLPAAECWKPGPASIQWGDIPADHWRVNNPWIPAVPVQQ